MSAFLAGKTSPVAFHLGFVDIIFFRTFLTNCQHRYPPFNVIDLAVRLPGKTARFQVTLFSYRALLGIGQIKIVRTPAFNIDES